MGRHFVYLLPLASGAFLAFLTVRARRRGER